MADEINLMAIPPSGSFSSNDVAIEIWKSSIAFSSDHADARKLAGNTSGAYSSMDWLGKSWMGNPVVKRSHLSPFRRYNVAISDDGVYIAAAGSNALELFKWNGSNYASVSTLTGNYTYVKADSSFTYFTGSGGLIAKRTGDTLSLDYTMSGAYSSITADGVYADCFTAATNSRQVRRYKRTGTTWALESTNTINCDHTSGYLAIEISSNIDTLAVQTYYNGTYKMRVHKRSGTEWLETAVMSWTGRRYTGIMLSANGNRIVAFSGINNADIYSYKSMCLNVTPEGTASYDADFPKIPCDAISISEEGNIISVGGGRHENKTTVVRYVDNVWQSTALQPNHQNTYYEFGRYLNVSNNGQFLAIRSTDGYWDDYDEVVVDVGCLDVFGS